mmetsp:Transcript_11456/g.17050  ORF Transcript_11456/g.17050 Transcript_11456/m.17050 type:complete len:216 (+) Transcript_11456:368-1015(+)
MFGRGTCWATPPSDSGTEYGFRTFLRTNRPSLAAAETTSFEHNAYFLKWSPETAIKAELTKLGLNRQSRDSSKKPAINSVFSIAKWSKLDKPNRIVCSSWPSNPLEKAASAETLRPAKIIPTTSTATSVTLRMSSKDRKGSFLDDEEWRLPFPLILRLFLPMNGSSETLSKGWAMVSTIFVSFGRSFEVIGSKIAFDAAPPMESMAFRIIFNKNG